MISYRVPVCWTLWSYIDVEALDAADAAVVVEAMRGTHGVKPRNRVVNYEDEFEVDRDGILLTAAYIYKGNE